MGVWRYGARPGKRERSASARRRPTDNQQGCNQHTASSPRTSRWDQHSPRVRDHVCGVVRGIWPHHGSQHNRRNEASLRGRPPPEARSQTRIADETAKGSVCVVHQAGRHACMDAYACSSSIGHLVLCGKQLGRGHPWLPCLSQGWAERGRQQQGGRRGGRVGRGAPWRAQSMAKHRKEGAGLSRGGHQQLGNRRRRLPR